MHGGKSIARFHYIFHGCSNKTLRFPCINATNTHFWWNGSKKTMISNQNLFWRRNNLSPHISFWRVAMFASWRSHRSLRKHMEPITGNSFINDNFPYQLWQAAPRKDLRRGWLVAMYLTTSVGFDATNHLCHLLVWNHQSLDIIAVKSAFSTERCHSTNILYCFNCNLWRKVYKSHDKSLLTDQNDLYLVPHTCAMIS